MDSLAVAAAVVKLVRRARRPVARARPPIVQCGEASVRRDSDSTVTAGCFCMLSGAKGVMMMLSARAYRTDDPTGNSKSKVTDLAPTGPNRNCELGRQVMIINRDNKHSRCDACLGDPQPAQPLWAP